MSSKLKIIRLYTELVISYSLDNQDDRLSDMVKDRLIHELKTHSDEYNDNVLKDLKKVFE